MRQLVKTENEFDNLFREKGKKLKVFTNDCLRSYSGRGKKYFDYSGNIILFVCLLVCLIEDILLRSNA